MAEETPAGPPPVGSTAENVTDKAANAVSAAGAAVRNQLQDGAEALRPEGPGIATAALVGVGLAIIEPELIPGMLIGVGATLAPKILPGIGAMLRPMLKGVIKVGYSAAMSVREVVAEAGEQVEDIVAEARAEHEASGGVAAPVAASPAPQEQGARRHRRHQHPQPQPDAI